MVPLDEGEELHERKLKGDEPAGKQAQGQGDLRPGPGGRQAASSVILFFPLASPRNRGTKLTGRRLWVVIFPARFSTSTRVWKKKGEPTGMIMRPPSLSWASAGVAE
jgi:hypothetical protein